MQYCYNQHKSNEKAAISIFAETNYSSGAITTNLYLMRGTGLLLIEPYLLEAEE